MFDVLVQAITEKDEFTIRSAQYYIDECIKAVFSQNETVYTQKDIIGEDCHEYSIVNIV